jgi:hypothetical protein
MKEASNLDRDFHNPFLHQTNCIESFNLNYNSNTSLFSSLTFLTENNMDFVHLFTNIDFEKYKHKDFPNEFEKSLCFSYPEIGKTIVYDSSKYNGQILLNEKYDQNITILYVNYFEKDIYFDFYTNNTIKKYKLLNINYNIEFYKNSIVSSPIELIENNEFLNYNFIENLFYQKNKTLLKEFNTKIIKNIENLKCISYNNDCSVELNNLTYYISSFEKPYLQCSFYKKLCEIYGKGIIDEYYKLQILNKTPYDVENENIVFKNKMLYCNTIFTKEICKWTRKEIDFYINKTNFIKLEHIQNIFNFYLILMESIFDMIKKHYVTSKMTYNIVDLLFISNTQINKELNDIINKQKVFFKIFISLDCNENQKIFVFINNLECKNEISNFLEKNKNRLFLYSNINLYP